jgi:hypothetical protein
LILLDGISFLHIPAQQFHLGDAFANVRELELTCHALTSQRQDRVLRTECCVGKDPEPSALITQHWF